MQERPATILFFGRPGAGKSTQAESLAEYFREASELPVLPFLWSFVRDEFMRGNSSVQEKIRENHAAGRLQPKFFSISVWGPVLLRQLTGKEHLIIDGVPRQLFEAEALHSAFEFFDRGSVLVFNMSIPSESAAARMRGRARNEGRIDDANEESIIRRLEWYESDTKPVLDYFLRDPKYIVVDIDADRPKHEVTQDLEEVVARTFGTSLAHPPTPTHTIGEPTILVSIGMPGAGKTSILKPLADRHGLSYVSRDEIRKEFFGDPLLQQDKDRVWKEADNRIQSALAKGQSAVYDATFAERDKRRDFITALRAMGWKRVIGLYVNTHSAVAIERNRNREHVVPESELEEHFIKPLEKNPPSVEDGFDELYTLVDVEKLEYLLKEG